MTSYLPDLSRLEQEASAEEGLERIMSRAFRERWSAERFLDYYADWLADIERRAQLFAESIGDPE